MIAHFSDLRKIVCNRYFANEEGDSMWVYSPYITKNGVRIYRKDGKVFRFWVDDDKAPKNTSSAKGEE
jgi:hypothetical protein